MIILIHTVMRNLGASFAKAEKRNDIQKRHFEEYRKATSCSKSSFDGDDSGGDVKGDDDRWLWWWFLVLMEAMVSGNVGCDGDK